jgi:hypothetical protein
MMKHHPGRLSLTKVPYLETKIEENLILFIIIMKKSPNTQIL